MNNKEIIKEAYGKFYTLLENEINDFGWIQISEWDDFYDSLI
jgi:hypothetical protein